MIKSLIARSNYEIPFVNATLKTDWDLLVLIHHQTYKVCKIKIHHYQWVQGHQDSLQSHINLANTECSQITKRLSQEAKYNIRADELAGDYPVQIDKLSCRLPQ
jgi:hypothetical protein